MIKKLLITIYALFSSIAFASTSTTVSILDLPATDKIYQIFGAMFGGLGVFGSGSNPFLKQMAIIDNGLLVFSGLITAYLILNWVIKVAHEAELGRRATDAWQIIRYVSACALILPVINGYSTAQYLTATVVKYGIALSYNTANILFDGETIQEVSITSLAPKKIDAVAHNLFLSSVCRYAFEEAYKNPTYVQSTGGVVPKFGITKEKGFFQDVVHIGEVGHKNGYNKDFCGSYLIPTYESSKSVISGAKYESTEVAILVNKNNSLLAAKLFNDVDKAAKELVDSKNLEVYKKVSAAAQEYSKNSADYAFNLVKNENKIKQMSDAVKVDGALYTGAYYMRITELQSKVNEAIAKVPSATGIKEIPDAMIAEVLRPYVGLINEVVKEQNLSMTIGINGIDGNKDSSWWDTIKGAVTGDPELIIKKIISSAISPITFDEKSNLVTSTQTIGAWALSAGSALVLLAGGLLIVGGVTPGIANFIQTITEFFAPPLLLFGATALFITPMIPFYIFTGIMIAWICSATATIIIANFIPVCMMFNGSDTMGQGANAFRQLLSILFKPALSVVCFCASIVITGLIGQAVMSIFISAWNLAQDESGIIVYLVSLIFLVASYALFSSFLIFQITMTCMKMADPMLSFIGGAGVQLGGDAATYGNSGAAMAAGAAGGMAANALSGAKEYSSSKNNASSLGNGSDPLKGKGMGNVAPSGESASNAGLNKSPSANSFSEVKKNSSSSTSDEAAPVEQVDYSQQIAEFELGEKYDDAYQSLKEQKPDASHNEAANYALNSAISYKYGAGSGKAVAAAGNGDYKNADSQMMLAMYRTAQEAGLSRNELKEISSKINDGDLKGDDAIKEFAVNFSQKINNNES